MTRRRTTSDEAYAPMRSNCETAQDAVGRRLRRDGAEPAHAPERRRKVTTSPSVMRRTVEACSSVPAPSCSTPTSWIETLMTQRDGGQHHFQAKISPDLLSMASRQPAGATYARQPLMVTTSMSTLRMGWKRTRSSASTPKTVFSGTAMAAMTTVRNSAAIGLQRVQDGEADPVEDHGDGQHAQRPPVPAGDRDPWLAWPAPGTARSVSSSARRCERSHQQHGERDEEQQGHGHTNVSTG